MNAPRQFVEPVGDVACVVFDLDGTLYPQSLYLSRYVELVTRALRELTGMDQVESSRVVRAAGLSSGTSGGSASALLASVGVPISAWNQYRDSLPDMSRLVAEDVELVTAVRALAAVVPTALVTNNTARGTGRVLAALGFGQADFAVTLTADAGLRPKPSYELFTAAARTLGCPPTTMVSIGDRWPVDIAPVVALGGGGILVDGPRQVVVACHRLAERLRTAQPARTDR